MYAHLIKKCGLLLAPDGRQPNASLFLSLWSVQVNFTSCSSGKAGGGMSMSIAYNNSATLDDVNFTSYSSDSYGGDIYTCSSNNHATLDDV